MSTIGTPIDDEPRAPRGVAGARHRRTFRFGDSLFHGVTLVGGVFIALAVIALAVVLVRNAMPLLTTGWRQFFTTMTWAPTEGLYGAGTPLVGTALSTGIAIVLAVPPALTVALLLVELVHPYVARVVGTTIEMLAAVPSIIYGMVGLFVVVPFVQERLVPWLLETPLGEVPGLRPGPTFQGGGVSVLTAGVVLGFMILPYITAVSRDVLRMVPTVTKEAGYGMGSTTWEVLRRVSLPYANSGIIGAVFIGLGRAFGETMAVAFIIGSVFDQPPRSLLDPATTIASLMANTFNEATEEIHIAALISLALLLFAITLLFQVIAQVWLARARRRSGARA